ncbi:hypothetical protein HY450_04090 [Candidatus Pacearchaeota archaeon]|nr:hypothetical protein [Candidatus Pacearchaeota archaeon]
MTDYLKAGYEFSDLVRPAPAAENFGSIRRRELEEEIFPEYLTFLRRSRVPVEVVHNVVDMAKKKGYLSGVQDRQPFFVTSREANTFALVHPGREPNRLNRGLRLILTHVDSPCLKLKVSPTLFEGSKNETILTSSVLLDTQPYGEIEPSQWAGRNVRLIGLKTQKGKKRKVEIQCFTPIYSLHVKNGDQKISLDDLKIATGLNSVREVYKAFGIEHEAEFARINSHIIPDERARRIKGTDFITGYGQDDRVGVYAAVKALLDSKPTSPCFVFGLDKEEIGSSGPSTAYLGFFRRVLSEALSALSKSSRKSNFILEDQLDRNIMKGYPAISADTDVASMFFESQNESIDQGNIAKFCHGPFIYASETPEGNTVRSCDIDYFMSLFEETLGRSEKIAHKRFQIIGNPVKPSHGRTSGTLADIFARQNIPSVDIGVPVGCLHNPTELVNLIDLYWTIQAYKVYFQERPFNRGGGKRKFG